MAKKKVTEPEPAEPEPTATDGSASKSEIVRELIGEWHAEGKDIDERGFNEALFTELQKRHPSAGITLNDVSNGKSSWRNKMGIEPKRRAGRTASPEPTTRAEPTLTDLMEVSSYCQQEGYSVDDLLQRVEEIQKLGEQFGGLPTLVKCLRALKNFAGLK